MQRFNRLDIMIHDREHWANLKPPLSPSDHDVDIYKAFVYGDSVLLLGSTKELLEMATIAVDGDPQSDGIKSGCWKDIEGYYDTVMADGCLCFNKELSDILILRFSIRCGRFIGRVFNHKLEGMKYAAYFPMASDFNFKPDVTIKFDKYSFYIWNFNTKKGTK